MPDAINGAALLYSALRYNERHRLQGQAAVQALARQTRGGPPAPSRLLVPSPWGARLGDDVDSSPLSGARCFMPDAAHKPASFLFAGTHIKSEWLQGQAAVQALARQTRGGPPSPPRLQVPPPWAARFADDVDMRPPAGARRFMPERDITPPLARSSAPLRGPGSCTLWVGQVRAPSDLIILWELYEDFPI